MKPVDRETNDPGLSALQRQALNELFERDTITLERELAHAPLPSPQTLLSMAHELDEAQERRQRERLALLPMTVVRIVAGLSTLAAALVLLMRSPDPLGPLRGMAEQTSELRETLSSDPTGLTIAMLTAWVVGFALLHLQETWSVD